MFDRGQFDIVHARNTLDHSYDPVRAVRQMAEVTKPGGAVILHHYRNEAKNEGYKGLHRWNLAVDSAGSFVISRPKKPWGMEHLDVAAELSDVLELVSTKDPHDEPEMDLVVFRRRGG
jgi:SAM-dependent methyltransferase